MNFKSTRSFCREISSIFVSMTNRINNIMLLNTPAWAWLITRRGFYARRGFYSSQMLRMENGGFLNVRKKIQNDCFHLSIFPPPSRSATALLESARSEYLQSIRGSSIRRRRYLPTVGEITVYARTCIEVRIEIEDAMSDLARARFKPAPGYARNFQRCGCEAHSREENTD